jgi:hypothetical protein
VAEGKWKTAVAKRTSSSCIPASGRKASPRPKNRRGRIAEGHLRSLKLGKAIILGTNLEALERVLEAWNF